MWDFRANLCESQQLVFFVIQLFPLVCNKFSLGLRWKCCFPGLTRLHTSAPSPTCSVGPPHSQPRQEGRSAASETVWERGRSSGPRYVGVPPAHTLRCSTTLSKPLHLSEHALSFANEVLGFRVPEAPPATTFQTALPWEHRTRALWDRADARNFQGWRTHLGAQSTCRQPSGVLLVVYQEGEPLWKMLR